MRLPHPLLFSFVVAGVANIAYYQYSKHTTSEDSKPRFDTGLRLPAIYKYVSSFGTLFDIERLSTISNKLLRLPRNIRFGLGLINVPDQDEALEVDVMNLHWRNPIGFAAGVDRTGLAISGCLDLGVGFVEVGSVTPYSQSGNPARPRSWYDEHNTNMIDNLGHPNPGSTLASHFIDVQYTDNKYFNYAPEKRGIVGVNLGFANSYYDTSKVTAKDIIHEMTNAYVNVSKNASYVAINLSHGLPLSSSDFVTLLQNILAERDKLVPDTQLRPKNASTVLPPNKLSQYSKQAQQRLLSREGKPPLLLKVGHDLDDTQKQFIAKVCLELGIDGLIVNGGSYTRPHVQNPEARTNIYKHGGILSGSYIKDEASSNISKYYKLTKGVVPIIGAGGILNGADAYQKIKAGASLVQIYTALVKSGPNIIPTLQQELKQELKKDGFEHISQAVGIDADRFL